MLHTAILVLHVIGASITLGSIVVSLVILAQPYSGISLVFLRATKRVMGAALGAQFVTGVYLILSERAELENNRYLWVKLGLYVVGGAVTNMMLSRRMKQLGTSTADVALEVAGLRRDYRWLVVLVVTIATLGVVVSESMK